MDISSILTVVLILLALSGIWLIVEIVLTVRRARPVMDAVEKTVRDAQPVMAHADELIEQVKPVVSHIDEAIGGAKTGIEQVGPVLTRTSVAVEALSADLQRIDAILGDVSRISKTAGNATVAVGDAAGTIATKARSLFSRGRAAGRSAVAAPEREVSAIEGAGCDEACDEAPNAPGAQPASVCEDEGYFTYPTASGSER